MIESDNIQVKENLTFKTLPLRIEDQRVKQLKGKEIPWSKSYGEELLRIVLHESWKVI